MLRSSSSGRSKSSVLGGAVVGVPERGEDCDAADCAAAPESKRAAGSRFFLSGGRRGRAAAAKACLIALAALAIVSTVVSKKRARYENRLDECVSSHPTISLPPAAVEQQQRQPADGVSEVLEEDDDDKSSRIPKIIHFVHISPGILKESSHPSKSISANVEDWKEMHPDWTVRLWTNDDVRDALLGDDGDGGDDDEGSLLRLVSRIGSPLSWMSNLLRYAILYRYGGVYLDTDVLPIRSLDELIGSSCMSRSKAFAVCEDPASDFPASADDLKTRWDECPTACNAVIGAEPGSSATRDTLAESIANTKRELCARELRGGAPRGYDLSISGPPLWTQVARESGHVDVLRSATFFPCSFWDAHPRFRRWGESRCDRADFRDRAGTFAMHAWAKTWKAQEFSALSDE